MEGDTSTFQDPGATWASAMTPDRFPDAGVPARAVATRRPLQVQFPFAVLVRWRDRTGQHCEIRTVVDTLTPTTVELRLDRPILSHRPPLLVIRLARQAADPALQLACLGTVQRIEPQPDGCWAHTITFTHYRFIYATPVGPEPIPDGGS
jgi:hypothetical protein